MTKPTRGSGDLVQFPWWPRDVGWWAPTCGQGPAHLVLRHVADGVCHYETLCGQFNRNARYVEITDPRRTCQKCASLLREERQRLRQRLTL